MKKIIKLNLINICLLSFLELIFGILMFDTFIRDTIISVFIHILFSSFIITLLTTLFNRKINKIIETKLENLIIDRIISNDSLEIYNLPQTVTT